MLTLLHSNPISPGFVYQSAIYRVSESRTYPCWVSYYQLGGDEVNCIELYGATVEYRPLRTMRELFGDAVKSNQEYTVGRDRVLERSPAFIRCKDLFLFASKLVIEKGVASDLLIEGNWELKRLVRTSEGDKFNIRECGEEIYSCPFTEMFQL